MYILFIAIALLAIIAFVLRKRKWKRCLNESVMAFIQFSTEFSEVLQQEELPESEFRKSIQSVWDEEEVSLDTEGLIIVFIGNVVCFAFKDAFSLRTGLYNSAKFLMDVVHFREFIFGKLVSDELKEQVSQKLQKLERQMLIFGESIERLPPVILDN